MAAMPYANGCIVPYAVAAFVIQPRAVDCSREVGTGCMCVGTCGGSVRHEHHRSSVPPASSMLESCRLSPSQPRPPYQHTPARARLTNPMGGTNCACPSLPSAPTQQPEPASPIRNPLLSGYSLPFFGRVHATVVAGHRLPLWLGTGYRCGWAQATVMAGYRPPLASRLQLAAVPLACVYDRTAVTRSLLMKPNTPACRTVNMGQTINY